MAPILIHSLFDLLAATSALAMTTFCYFWRLKPQMARIESAGVVYAAALVLGAATGGYGAGTLNLWLSGIPGLGRSVVGALAGAILAIETFKRWKGLRGSTGIVFVPGFVTSLVVGRWGCFFAGLPDQTYGTATTLPWAHDFGDGVLRHPVQLYESMAMAIFLVAALILLARRCLYFLTNGFYLMVLYYAGQRFVWEFFKPYAPVAGPFNLFHVVCLGLIVYSTVMMRKEQVP